MDNFTKSIMNMYYDLFKNHFEPPHLIIIKNKGIKFYEKQLEKPNKKWFDWRVIFWRKNNQINFLDKRFNSKSATKLLILRKPSFPDCDVEFIYFGNNFSYNVIKQVPININIETNEISEVNINLTKYKQPDVHYKFNINEESELVEFN